MMLEQETNALDIVFFMGSNPRVRKKTHMSYKNACVLTDMSLIYDSGQPCTMQETFSMIIDKNGKSLIPPPWEVRNTHTHTHTPCINHINGLILSKKIIQFSPWNQFTSEEDVSGSERAA